MRILDYWITLTLLAVFLVVIIGPFIVGSPDKDNQDSPVVGEGTIEYNQEGFVVYTSTINTEADGTLFIKKPEYTEILSNDCLKEKDGGFLTHKVRSECDSVEIVAISYLRNLANDENKSGLYYESGTAMARQSQSEISIWWHSSGRESDKSGWQNAYLTDIGKMDVKSNVTVDAPYVMAGNNWNTTRFQVNGQDTATVHYMESSDRSHRQALRNVSIPADSESEEVSFAIVNGSQSRTGELGFGGAYFPGANGIIVDGRSDPGATIHEFSHSQQTYDTQRTMRWMVEATATYNANSEMGELGYKTRVEMRNDMNMTNNNKTAETVLAYPSTWNNLTPYTEGMAVLAMVDSCIQRNSETGNLTNIQRDLQSPNTTVTFDLFVKKITTQVQPSVSEQTISDWLKPYVFKQTPVERVETVGQGGCWNGGE